MKRCVGVLVAGALALASAAGAVYWRYQFPASDRPILLLGTFHFVDAGLDSDEPELDVDILSGMRATLQASDGRGLDQEAFEVIYSCGE